MTHDPVDLFIAASEEDSRAARIAGYLGVIDALNSGEGDWWPGYVASLRARSLCGLVRDGEASVESAIDEVDRAVELGAPCLALLSLAEMHFALAQWEEVLDAVRRIPKSCFSGSVRAVKRFKVWDLRAAAAAKVGRFGECRLYASRIVSWMEPDDPRGLEWSPPWRTVGALLEAVGEGRQGANEAQRLLQAMSARIDLSDWFPDDMRMRIEETVRPLSSDQAHDVALRHPE